MIVVGNALELDGLECRDQLTLVNTVPSVLLEVLRMKSYPSFGPGGESGRGGIESSACQASL